MRGRKRHRKKAWRKMKAHMREGAVPTAAEITWGTPPYSWELRPGEKPRKW
jgi:hypothetical protein